MAGMLPGRDRKVSWSAPSTMQKARQYISRTKGKYGNYGRSFANSVLGRK
jgi:hypothetical protein